MRLVQILGDGIEELYNVPDHWDNEQVKYLWDKYKESDSEEFEKFVNYSTFSGEIERVFVDEIYV